MLPTTETPSISPSRLLATARIMVSMLKTQRETGQFFALHPKQLTESLYALDAVLAQLAALEARP